MAETYTTNWVFFLDCSTEEKATRVMERVKGALSLPLAEVTVEAYHKGGFRVEATTSQQAPFWESYFVELLIAAEDIGRGWTVGAMRDLPDGLCSDLSISGLTMVHWTAPSRK